MIKTTNYKLNMPETSDALSIAPLNENTQKIDGMLHGLTKMVCGSYVGNGGMSVSIQTPGMKPQALLVRCWRYAEPSVRPVEESLATMPEAQHSSSGFVMWIGQDLPKNYWIKDGKIWSDLVQDYRDACYGKKGTIVFTSANGSLSWTLSANPAPAADIDHSPLVNNKRGYTYDWIAFGTAQG